MDLPVIPVFRPSLLCSAGHPRLDETLSSSWWGTGAMVIEFEKRFAEYVGVEAERCLMLNSCTSALHLAVLLYPKARRFLVPGITFVSTALAPLYAGKSVVFVEVGDDLCIDQDDALNKMVDGDVVIAVHMGGMAADLTRLRGRCSIIEDAAHALGTYHIERHVGTVETGCFSFQATKMLPIGDGGMLIMPEGANRQRLAALAWCGIEGTTWDRTSSSYKWQYQINESGFKYRANDLQAALALDQWSELHRALAEKRLIADNYRVGLDDLDWLVLPKVRLPSSPSWQEFIIRTPYRDRLHDHLEELGVSTTVHYTPINQYKPFWGVDEGLASPQSLPRTEALATQILTIPSYVGMTDEEQGRVIDGVRSFKP